MIQIGNGQIHSMQRAVHICRAAMDMLCAVDEHPNKISEPDDT